MESRRRDCLRLQSRYAVTAVSLACGLFRPDGCVPTGGDGIARGYRAGVGSVTQMPEFDLVARAVR